MVYHLLHGFQDGLKQIGFYAWQEVSFRCITAFLTAFAVFLAIGPQIIRWLKSKNINDKPEFFYDNINALNKGKSGIPTMGGLIILIGMLSGTLLWAKFDNPFIHKMIFVLLWYGAIGAADDWLKLTIPKGARRRDGLKAWEKLLFQCGGAGFLFRDFANIEDARRLWLPFYKYGIGRSSSCRSCMLPP